MQHGGGSKDTWVLANAPEASVSLLRPAGAPVSVSRATFDLPSRVADDLFWLGRYVERFEAGVRAARAIPLRLFQGGDPGAAAALGVCRRVLTLEPDAPATPGFNDREFMHLVDADESRGSLRAEVREIRRLAWLLRDRMSADAWRVLKHLEETFLARPPGVVRVSWAQDLLDEAVLALAAFGGLATENMTRGHGWRFLDIGRRLERAFQTVHLVRRGMAGMPGEAELSVLLEIADSTLTYRSRYLNAMRANLVLDLLLLDESNPRSVVFQLARLRGHVDELPESSSNGVQTREARLALAMLTAVQLSEAEAILAVADDAGRLTALLDLSERLVSDLGAIIRSSYARLLRACRSRAPVVAPVAAQVMQ